MTLLYSDWIKEVDSIMGHFVQQTEGSFIKHKESGIVWDHSGTEYEFGKLQAKELKSTLENVFQHL